MSIIYMSITVITKYRSYIMKIHIFTYILFQIELNFINLKYTSHTGDILFTTTIHIFENLIILNIYHTYIWDINGYYKC